MIAFGKMLSNMTDNYAIVIRMLSTDQLKVVQDYLQLLGLEPDVTIAYMAMLRLGPCSVLQVSKVTGASRTQTYRYIDVLQGKGLVSAEQLSYGTLFTALPAENLEALIAAREADTASLKQGLANIAATIGQVTNSSGPQSTTLHYYGSAGLKQVNWNLTKARGSYKVFEAAHLSDHLDKAFSRRCRERYMERQLTSYDLTNSLTVQAKDIEPFEPSRTFIRHISPEILHINFEMYLYDSTVTMIDYGPQQPQATEIHHPALKAMMEQLFDAIWGMAQPIKIR